MTDLAEHLDETLAPEGHRGEGFSVTDKASADWTVRKVARIRRALAEEEEIAAKEMERITEWIEGRRSHAEAESAHFLDLLEAFHRSLLEVDERAKTVSLPSGKLKARKLPDAWTFDDDAFLAWARDNARELIRTKESAAVSDAKKALTPRLDESGFGTAVTEDGEVVPGIAIERGATRFSVEVSP